jgi:Ca2+-binding EF-hand superfamily protein
MEFEVCVHSYSTKNKSQALQLEQTGKLTREQPTKFQHPQNSWRILTASDPSAAEPIAEPPRYSAEDLIKEIKAKLVTRGTTSIRGLRKIFSQLDQNGNNQIELRELQWGLKDFDIYLDDEMGKVVLNHFDRDGSGTISFNEFLRAIRGEPNANRIAIIRKAYQKLDVNGDGLVKLDDIAQLFSVNGHPDVTSGKMSPDDAYRNFMKLWDT